METKLLEFIFVNYGVYGVVGIIIILALIKIPQPLAKIKSLFGWLRASRVVHHTPRDVLLSKLDYWLNFKISNIKMNDPGRQLLFRDILKLKFEQFKNYVETAHNNTTEELSGAEMFHVVCEAFNETVSAYEADALARGVPEVVMIKYAEWQLRSYDFALRSTEMICLSHGYGSNEARMQAIYSLITAMMELTIAEAEKTLTELNGELTGIEYKGVVCG